MQTKPSSYDNAVGRAFHAVLGQALAAPSPAQVREACERLRKANPPGRALLLENSARVRRFEVAQRLAQDAFALRFQDPRQMRELAELAVEVAEASDSECASEGLVFDTRALAWAYLANALRILGDFDRARACWAQADRYRPAGTGDPLLEAELLTLKADLYVDTTQLTESIELLRCAVQLYEQVGDTHLMGRSFVQLGRAYAVSHRYADAVRSYYSGLQRIEPGREENLVFIAILNLAVNLAKVGELQTALSTLRQLAPVFDASPGNGLVLKIRWIEADLLREAGLTAQAVASYAAVRRGYMASGQDFHAASAALCEAVVLAEVGDWSQVRELAEEMYPIFHSRSIEREAAAALLLFTQAVEQQTATVRLLRELKERVDKTANAS